jgi:hypothetical protein
MLDEPGATGNYCRMDFEPKLTVTWEHVMSVARRLEDAAFRNSVPPEEGARLVRLVLQFNDNIIGGVHKATHGTPAPDAKTG